MLEFFGSDILYFNFEKVIHHFLAMFLFILTYLEHDLISVVYVIPFWFHAFHALLPRGILKSIILYSYAVCLFFAILVIVLFCYNRKQKLCSIKPVFIAILLYHTNAWSFFYGYYIKILELDFYKTVISLIFSSFLSLPFYIYLIYVNSNWDLKKIYSSTNEKENFFKP